MTAPAPIRIVVGVEPTDLDRVLAYHRVTKHQPQRFARSLGYMDWDTQPDPFRRFEGAPRFDLPLAAGEVATRYADLYEPGAVTPRALDADALGAFFQLALGLTAWKQYGDARWSLRADPSSGNLHPTEAYAVLPAIGDAAAGGIACGAHHYLSHDHCLERRAELAGDAARDLAARLPAGGFLVAVTSIHWRESWKYGERAFRYCQHDAGHVLATLRIAAAALGWSARLVEGASDDVIAAIAGVERAEYGRLDPVEAEHADFLLAVAPPSERGAEVDAAAVANALRGAAWTGAPNALSDDHHAWDVIDVVAQAARYPEDTARGLDGAERREPEALPLVPPALANGMPVPDVRAEHVVRTRRSAVAMDGRTSIPAARFYAMLDRLLPRAGVAPFDALPWAPRVHLAIFVHRVDGLAPGLYWFERDARVHDAIRAQLGDGPAWTRPDGCPEHLRLFTITERDLRGGAASISCGQDIAGGGAFSLGMIADFRRSLEVGPWWYRRLHWEAGAIGQVLYLEAEAHGVRATGIGCYFDDAMHRVLGLEDDRFQDLYHFTVGGAVEDERLQTHPAYAHLGARAKAAGEGATP